MRALLILASLASALAQSPQIDYPSQIRRTPALDVRSYQFTRTNGSGASGDLSVSGAGKVITLTPCPRGVAGANADHYVRISGGTGTAEAALITSGTCTSGAASGTIVITTANAHTGAWIVTSATAGLSEAMFVAGHGGAVQFPAGTFIMYATATTAVDMTIRGAGSTSTLLTYAPTTGDCIFFNGPGGAAEYFSVRDLTIYAGGTQTAGSFIHIKNKAYGVIDGVIMRQHFIGIRQEGSGGSYSNIFMGTNRPNSKGFDIDSPGGGYVYANGTYTNINIYGETNGSGIGIDIGPTFAGGTMSNLFIQQGAYGIRLNQQGGAVNELQISNFIIDEVSVFGIQINNSGAVGKVSSRISITNGIIATNATLLSQGFGVGIYGANTLSILVNNVSVSSGLNGLIIAGAKNVTVSNSKFNGRNGSATSLAPGISIETDAGTPADNIHIIGNTSGYGIVGNITPNQTHSIGLDIPDAVAHQRIVVENNQFFGSTLNARNLGTGSGYTFRNNVGIDDVIPALASGATLALPALQNPIFTVTGTTGVGAVTGCVAGQTFKFITTSGAVVFTAGASIGNTFTTVQNVPVDGFCDGTKAYLH